MLAWKDGGSTSKMLLLTASSFSESSRSWIRRPGSSQSWHQLSSGATEILPIIERWSPHILSYLNFLPMKNTSACACNATRHNWLTASLTLVQERWQSCTTMDNCSLLNAPLLIFQGYCTLLPCHSALPWIWFYLLALGWSCWLVLLCICPNTEHFRDFSFSEGGGGGDYLY